jgi:ketosteroid isomerase-like protein
MKKSSLFLISLILILPGFTNCKNQQTVFTDADMLQIRNISESAVKQFDSDKDVKAYVNSYYAEDATVLMPNAEAVKGNEAMIALFRTYGDFKLEFKINDISGSGDLAYVYGNYTLEVNGVKDQGKYIEIWKKGADKKWKTIYDISNSDLPAAGVTKSE